MICTLVSSGDGLSSDAVTTMVFFHLFIIYILYYNMLEIYAHDLHYQNRYFSSSCTNSVKYCLQQLAMLMCYARRFTFIEFVILLALMELCLI